MTYQSLIESIHSIWAPGLDRPRRRPVAALPDRRLDSTYQVLGKRFLDVILSVAALVLFSPLMLVVAVLIKATSPGPVLFKQERVGINRRLGDRRRKNLPVAQDRRRKDRRVLVNFGKPFTIYKFRTMRADAEREKPLWASKNDPRITTLGRILRKTRIDEIPQFVNVIKGEMSIVGPRPERAFFIGKAEKEIPRFQLRLYAKPGITGLAQVKLGYTNDTEGLRKKLEWDLEYLRRLNLSTDLKILFQTLAVVLTGKGAY